MLGWRDPGRLDEIEAWLRLQTTREAAQAALAHADQFPDPERAELLFDSGQLAVRLCSSQGKREVLLGAPDEEEILASLSVFPLRQLAILLGLELLREVKEALTLVAKFQLEVELETFSDLQALVLLMRAAGSRKRTDLDELAASLKSQGEAQH
jgi:hypothetical protein